MSNFNINEDAQSGGEYSGSQSSNADPPTQPSDSAFPDEEEETITMLDVIEQEDKLEEEASAVLGNSDEKNCTYPKGYIGRQALYSCATCSDDPDNMAAICLACSLECHDNHEVIELYTKRGYRCDCGNSKFKPDFECKFLTDKQTKKVPLNEQNKYNHNFNGRYCSCDKRYPPDENDNSAEAQDEMWQCIVCEDWYHSKHLGVKDLPTRFDELICGTCVGKLDFVYYYRDFIDKQPQVDQATKCETNNNNSEQAQTMTDSKLITNTATSNGDPASSVPDDDGADTKLGGEATTPESSTSQQTTNDSSNISNGQATTTVISEDGTNDSQVENKDPEKLAETADDQKTSITSATNSRVADECSLEKYKKLCESSSAQSDEVSTSDSRTNKSAPIFWLDCSWRTRLCRCVKCMLMYKAKECEYLLDEKDTVQYYEAQGKAIKRETPFERGMSALNQMNRTAVVEALNGYNELKADLSTYLRKFAESKKVVREEDIQDFFAQLRSKKRPRLEYE